MSNLLFRSKFLVLAVVVGMVLILEEIVNYSKVFFREKI